MSRCNKLKILFCIKILVGLFNAIVGNTIFDHWSVDQKKNYFGPLWNGSLPEFKEIKVASSPHTRTLSPEGYLSIEFNYYGTPTRTTLTKVENQELIGRNSTGFWFAESNANAYHNISYTPRPDIFDSIGNIEFYMNHDDFSAVTRFWNSSTGEETFTGILKGNYSLRSVPRRFYHGVITLVEHPLIQETIRTFTTVFIEVGNTEDLQVNFQHSTGESAPYFDEDVLLNLFNGTEEKYSGPINSPTVVYPKLLLAPSYNMWQDALNTKQLVQHLIAHVHTVDMVYRHLHDPEIRLHISGIIIPQDRNATPAYGHPDGLLITNEVVKAVTTYFVEEPFRFPHHTYDIVVSLTTENTPMLNEYGNIRRRPAGKAVLGSACSRPPFISRAVAVAEYSLDFLGVLYLTHELAHTFNAAHDALEKNCVPGDFIMSAVATTKRFVWSQCSRDAMSYYFKTRGFCAHKKPYEVPDEVKHLPSAWMSPAGQCQNQFKDENADCMQ